MALKVGSNELTLSPAELGAGVGVAGATVGAGVAGATVGVAGAMVGEGVAEDEQPTTIAATAIMDVTSFLVYKAELLLTELQSG